LAVWKKELIKYLNSFVFEKLNKKKVKKLLSLNTCKYEIPEGFTFPGGKITDVILGCRLSSDDALTLVFPYASAQIHLDVIFDQDPKVMLILSYKKMDLSLMNGICFIYDITKRGRRIFS
jgi:hypothetical protein